MLKIGIIGCGFMGGMHAACYQALGMEIAAVADPREDFARKLAGENTAVYPDGMQLIAQADVDVVDICLPTDLHTAHAVAAMKAGKAVFLEKPVCLSEDDMALLLKTEAETGAKVQVGQVIRHWDEYVWLKKTVASGIYGKVLSGSFRRLSNKPTWASENWLHDPSRSGSVAVDMHVHDADFVRYLLGDPAQVQSSAQRDKNGVIQHIMSIYRYDSGAVIFTEAGWDYPADFPFTATFSLKLEKATIVHDGGLTVYPLEGGSFKPNLEAAYEGNNDIGGNVSSLGGYYNELKYFLQGLQGENDLSIATLSEAIASVRLVKQEAQAAGGITL